MRVVIAPDKFKGSLTALEAAEAMARGVAGVDPSAQIDHVPMADGGEGTVEALVAATGDRSTRSRHRTAWRTGDRLVRPSGRRANRGHRDGLGLGSLARSIRRRDPWRATTRGTGELLLAAIEAGAGR